MNDIFPFLSQDQIVLDKSIIGTYELDRTKTYLSSPSVLLKPQNTEQVSQILKTCSKNNFRLIVVGGKTGLSGATAALNNEVLISLEKMNRIINIDHIGCTVSCEAGLILENLQNALTEQNLHFPLDFAAKGSCQVGGFIATNAGGVKVLKYGMTRDILLGLEVVLPNGETLNLDHQLIKNNTGYKLEQIFCGSEGSLGIITKASFKCTQIKKHKSLFLFSVDDFLKVTPLFKKIRDEFAELSAFEYLDQVSYRAVMKSLPQITQPFEESLKHLVLVETEEQYENDLFFEKLLEENLITDMRIAENSLNFSEFWKIREAVSDALYLLGKVHANDVSVPIKNLSSFLDELKVLFRKKYMTYTLGVFGHIGDGNLHIYVIDTNGVDDEIFRNETRILDDELFSLVSRYSGSISAEHGIGLLKKDALIYRRNEYELKIMKKIKTLFDPQNILNPGKIFDL